MKQVETIEILMATYNGEKYIKEQINSIINQTYKNWKLLIRDDGSKDKTIKIVKEYQKKDDRIKLLEDNKGNLGFVKNFEELIKNSKENYIMFSDQDDYWLENKIEKYVEVIENLDKKESQNPLLIHSNSYVCDEKLNVLKEKFVDSRIANESEGNNYFFSYIVQGATALVNKKMIEISLPFSKNIKLHDRYFHLLSEFLGRRVFIDENFMKYRQHNGNEIGAKGSIVKKILRKRYFDENDREMIIEIGKKYENELIEKKKLLIKEYLEVTDRKTNRIIRIIKGFKFKMNLKKRIFMLLKG